MTREYDPMEEALIGNCAADCYATINESDTTRVSKWFKSGGDHIRVSVSVYSESDIAARKKQVVPAKAKPAKKTKK